MPELPEVETIRCLLDRELKGSRLLECQFIRMRPWNPDSTRVLSHIFHPFKETTPLLPFRSVTAYLNTYRHAFLFCLKYLEQRVLQNVERRGKYLIFNFTTSPRLQSTHHQNTQLVTHLKMAGKFLLNPPRLRVHDRTQHVHLVLVFKKYSQRQTLVYSDTRFGEILPCLAPVAVTTICKQQRLSPSRQKQINAIYQLLRSATTQRLGRIGVEPLTATTLANLKPILSKLLETLKKYKRAQMKHTLHSVLLDGSQIAGIGNIYANEICHRTQLHPLRDFTTLSSRECRNLAQTIPQILAGAILRRGTSLDTLAKNTQIAAIKQDPAKVINASTTQISKPSQTQPISANHFRLPDGAPGDYACTLRVYGRTGEPCLKRTCTGNIERIAERGRSVYVCSICQR